MKVVNILTTTKAKKIRMTMESPNTMEAMIGANTPKELKAATVSEYVELAIPNRLVIRPENPI